MKGAEPGKEPWQLTQAEFLAELATQNRQWLATYKAEAEQIQQDLKRRMPPHQHKKLQERHTQLADSV